MKRIWGHRVKHATATGTKSTFRQTIVLLAGFVLAGCSGAAQSGRGGAAEPSSTQTTTDATTAGGAGETAAVPPASTASPQAVEEETPPEDDEALWSRMMELDHDLGDAMTLGTPDCDAARDLRDQICELAERICAISEAHPDERVAAHRCGDGNTRCERARNDVGNTCP